MLGGSHMITADRRVPPLPMITPLLVAELLVEGERWPVYVHVIDHSDARVLVDTGGRPVVVGGDVAGRFGELDEPRTEGQLRVCALEPELVWLAHEHEPWRPRDSSL